MTLIFTSGRCSINFHSVKLCRFQFRCFVCSIKLASVELVPMLKLIECKFATDNTRPEEMLDLTAERTSLI